MSPDPGRHIVGAEMRRTLVEAVRDADGGSVSEKSWIEWKTHVDLTVKDWHAEISKQIVAFANRMPDAAARHTGGHAYLLLGVEPGFLDGVMPVEDLQLSRDLRPYLGQTGPQWDAAYVQIGDQHVLVIDVMPPTWGDPVFQIWKEFKGAVREGPYVRRTGETTVASATELSQLVERAKRSASRIAVNLEWVDDEPTIDPIQLDEATLNRWAEMERSRIDRPGPPPVARSLFSLGLGGETRSRELFVRDLDLYLRKARELIGQKAQIEAMRRDIGAVRLRIINPTDRHLKDVRVEVELPAETRGAVDPADEDALLQFPDAPRPWGTSDLSYLSAGAYLGRNWIPSLPPPPPLGWVSGNGRVVTFAEKDLFAEDWMILPTLYVIADARCAGQGLEILWSARSASADGVARGTLALNVSTNVRAFAAIKGSFDVDQEATEE